MPSRIEPCREFSLPFIVKGDAALGMQQKSICADGTAWAGFGAGVTFTAVVEDLWFPPAVLNTGQIRDKGHQPVKTSQP